MARMYFDVWENGDYQGTALGELTDASDKHIRKAWRALGHGQFTINRHSSQFGWAAPDNLVRVRLVSGGPFAYDDARYKYAFIIEEGSDELVSPDEEGGEDVVRQGRDAVAVILKRAIIWPTSSHPDNGIYWERALKDGMVRFVAENFAEGGRSVGAVLRTFIRDAEARSPSPLEGMDDDFSYGLDSSGDSWTETDTDWEFPVGLNYLDLLGQLTSSGLFWDMTAACVLRAWDVDQGTDLSGSITFAKADNISWLAAREIKGREAVSDVVVKGTTKTDTMKFRVVTDSGMRTELAGRREAYLEYGSTPTDARLDLAGNRFIDKAADQRDGPTSLTAPDEGGAEAFVDYWPGDTVTVDIPGVWDELPTRISAISLDDIENGEYDPTIDFYEQEWNGSDSGGTDNCRSCPPLEPYVPGETEVCTGEEALTIVAAVNDATEETAFTNLANATDGSFATSSSRGSFAGSGVQDCAICINFGASVKVSSFTYRGSIAGLRWDLSSNCEVYVSDTPSGGTLVAATRTAVGSDDRIDIASPISGQYLRFRFPDPGPGLRFIPTVSLVEAISATGCIVSTAANPPIPGQRGNEQIDGVAEDTTYTTNYPYQQGTLDVTVICGDASSVVIPTEADPEAGEFTLPIDATGCTVVVRYVIASSTGTGETNPAPTPGGGGVPVTDHGGLTGLGDDDHAAYVKKIEGGQETINAIGTTGAAEDIDPSLGNVVTATLGDDTVFTILQPVGSANADLILWVNTGAGGFTPTIDADGGSFTWNGSTPTLSTDPGEVYRIVLERIPGTTNDWVGDLVGGGSGSPTGSAGGDLSGTYPNPSVVDDSHNHTAATLPASSSGDHEHIIDVFNGDASTTAFELSQEPFDPEQVFAFVGGSWTAVTMSGVMNTTATFGSAPGSGTGNVVIQYPAAVA